MRFGLSLGREDHPMIYGHRAVYHISYVDTSAVKFKWIRNLWRRFIRSARMVYARFFRKNRSYDPRISGKGHGK